MRCYISGPMTGHPDLNQAGFRDAEAKLRASGWEVVSPVDNGVPDEAPWADHLRADLAMLVTCDAIALLPGWSKSKGARLEAHVAGELGMRTVMDSDEAPGVVIGAAA